MGKANFFKELNADEFTKVLKTYLIEYIDTVNDKAKQFDTKSISGKSYEKENSINNKDSVEKLMNISESELIYRDIYNDLFRQALANGVHVSHELKIMNISASEGNVTDVVSFSSAEIKFVTKIDDDKEIINEATFLKIIESRIDLPADFSRYFPKVYAIKKDSPPYGYIMEVFNRKSLSKLLYEDKIELNKSKDIISKILEVLFRAYQYSINMTVMPNIKSLYLDKIRKKIQIARNFDNDFNIISKKSILINGRLYQPVEEYIDKIEFNIHNFQAPFTTFVHGDSYPENILIGQDEGGIDIKFIDPKGWFEGDFMFDIGKLSHYILVSGPVIKSNYNIIAQIDILKNIINYDLGDQSNIIQLIDIIKEQVRKFSIYNDDTNWENRYTLSIATILLSISESLLRKGDENSVYILYAEGLRYLSDCIN